MRGFGAFRELTTIDLTDVDLVALVGPTGSGKSTVIDAITFALYGTVARYDDNRLVAPIINQTSTEARVSLDFELEEQVYTAVRVVRRTTGGGATTREARLEQADQVLASDARSMSRDVEVLLRLDAEQFNRTVVLPQGKFADFLHDKPSDRQATLVQLLGADLYRRVGTAARSRGAVAKTKADALRPEHREMAEEITDERRAGLEKRTAKLNAALSRFVVDRTEIDRLNADLIALDDRIEALDQKIDRLEEIRIPAGIPEFSDQITAAIDAESQARTLYLQRQRLRRLANDAHKAGPDISTVRRGLDLHCDLAIQTSSVEDVTRDLQEATTRYETEHSKAIGLRVAQERLEGCVDECRKAERRAQDACEAEVSVTQVDDWAKLHGRYKEATQKAAKAVEAVSRAEAAILPVSKAFNDAVQAADVTSARVNELRRRAGVIGHIDLLQVGEDCPLCLQEVHEFPSHEFDDTEFREAKEDQVSARAAVEAANQEYEEAKEALLTLRAEATSALSAAQRCESDISSIPAPGQLESLRAEATRLAEAVRLARAATKKAETAAREHRYSETYIQALKAEEGAEKRVTQIKASKETLEDQLTSLLDKVADLPSKEALHDQLAQANRLSKELDQADSRLDAAETQHGRAIIQLTELNEQREQAISLLHRSRDHVAMHEPPAIDTSDLVSAWTTLNDWARDEAQSAVSERQAASEQKSTTLKRRATVLLELRTLCEDALGCINPDTTVEDLGLQLVEHGTKAKGDLEYFDQRRDYLRQLEKRIDDLTEQAQIADKLGLLLRADGFESWLMETALHRLVEQATKRLFVLSSGQYSLEVHERDFFVRDHSNADELRRARTLSGGETFLASLSLALALADTTAEMSTGDVPTMESIFLDEGFGTLDPETLDTVASAVEELGATGRLVGIVTHIRELADRMPVRLELTKTGGSATVERVEV